MIMIGLLLLLLLLLLMSLWCHGYAIIWHLHLLWMMRHRKWLRAPYHWLTYTMTDVILLSMMHLLLLMLMLLLMESVQLRTLLLLRSLI